MYLNEKRILYKSRKSLLLINELEDFCLKMSESEIKDYINTIKNSGSFLNEKEMIFAIVREVGKRVLNERVRDEQIIGGLSLTEPCIIEMQTGEGKTLAAIAPAVFLALKSKCYITTVNDYLAFRDYEWMYPVYAYLGLTIGCITKKSSRDERKSAYKKDIIYTTSSEISFDFLRDGLTISKEDIVISSELSNIIIDEADSVLIDNARVAFIISGDGIKKEDQFKNLLKIANKFVLNKLSIDMLKINERNKEVLMLTESYEALEIFYKEEFNAEINYNDNFFLVFLFFVKNAIRAHFILKKDRNYIVSKKNIVIIDEFTGRKAENRKFVGGIHQALEVKENLEISTIESSTSSISPPNFFNLFSHLSGMTGTAYTSKDEFEQIYNLTVVRIPTHSPKNRYDHNDIFFITKTEKEQYITNKVTHLIAKGQPVLIGTSSIDDSERISAYLKKINIKFNILNAKNDEKESMIIAEAGESGKVTIATNMAGRGTDIKIGGNLNVKIKKNPEKDISTIRKEIKENRKKALDAGGLFVIGTQRNDNIRIDLQLRGRCSRGVEKGETQFFISLEDPLAQTLGLDNLKYIISSTVGKDFSYINNILSGYIEYAQRIVESIQFDSRRSLFQFDSILHHFRMLVLDWRSIFLNIDYELKTQWILDNNKEIGNTILSNKFAREIINKSCRDTLKFINELWSDFILFSESIKTISFLSSDIQPIVLYKKSLEEGFKNLNKNIVPFFVELVYKNYETLLEEEF